MATRVTRGRGYLRGTGALQAMHEVTYAAYTSVKTAYHTKRPAVTSSRVFIEISPLGKDTLRNGSYSLEEDGQRIYVLEKNGESWLVRSSHAEAPADCAE
jgi:hypothetical protein